MEIENEIKRTLWVCRRLDERRHDVLGCLDKMKCYLQDLHR